MYSLFLALLAVRALADTLNNASLDIITGGSDNDTVSSDWIDFGTSGTATMTHYTIPDGYIASCGCVGDSTKYATAAMSQMAYGSSNAFGKGCGYCFELTLLNSYTGSPPFFPDVVKSLVVKVTDLCPLSTYGWCDGTTSKKNPGGQYINFDLAYPSRAIPDDFFPSNQSYYGYTDFGVWNISYSQVSCERWAGWKDTGALGSVDFLDSSSACCPANPTGNANDTCPSYSDQNGIAPDTTTTGSSIAPRLSIPLLTIISLFVLGIVLTGG
ncbi:Expansin-like EG45 domain-containing protein [Mycena kentingensis (nom. inval.)]|nr:Expansin-like EG45 domain-containing protein [Mycena kentingensis (nom. inval.)]